jgi:hypothetical protein
MVGIQCDMQVAVHGAANGDHAAFDGSASLDNAQPLRFIDVLP